MDTIAVWKCFGEKTHRYLKTPSKIPVSLTAYSAIVVDLTKHMIAMAWKHRNVHIGTDAHSPKNWPDALVRYINSHGQDEVIIGTDFPTLDFERTIREIDALRLHEKPFKKILRENAMEVLGLWQYQWYATR